MSQFLEGLLNERSPLVIGYSGWEEDVFMTSLKHRLKSSLEYKLYWFCHRRDNADRLPVWLKKTNVVFVLPPAPETVVEASSAGAPMKAGRAIASGVEADKRDPSTLGADEVLETLITTFALDEPPLTRDPLAFYAGHLRRNLPSEDAYLLQSTAGKIERAVALMAERLDEVDRLLNEMEGAIRRSQYRDAIVAAGQLRLADLQPDRLRGFVDSMWATAMALLDGSAEELKAYDLIQAAVERLEGDGMADARLRERHAQALVNRGFRLGELGREEEEVAIYDNLVVRFGDDAAPAIREQVAAAIINKGVALGGVGRSEEAITVYDAVLARFGDDATQAVRESVALALFNKGIRLGELGRSEAEIAVYDDVAARFGDDAGPTVREQVGKALFNKGFRLGELGRSEEAIAVYDNVAARLGDDAPLANREPAARALVSKGFTLGELGRGEEEIAAYDAIVARFGGDVIPAIREQVAQAIVNKGVRLGQLGRSEEEIAVYDDAVARFGGDSTPAIREQVAKALLHKGIRLGELGRGEEEIAAYDSVVARFDGDATPAQREWVVNALFNRAVALGKLGRAEERLAAFREVVARFGDEVGPEIKAIVGEARAILESDSLPEP
jgi:tetratricopeptide (TPR) repeat protein